MRQLNQEGVRREYSHVNSSCSAVSVSPFGRMSFFGLALAILVVSANLMHDSSSFRHTAAATALPVCDEGYVIINTNITWAAGCVHVTGGIVIEQGATLTLDPGVIVKFRSLTGIFVGHTPGAQAALIAHGTAVQPIVLTSYKDDSDLSGGDSNGDLAATSAGGGVIGAAS